MPQVIKTLIFLVLNLTFVVPFAYAEVANVSATVPEQGFNAPILISPTNNSAVNTSLPTFSWNRPTPAPASPLNHYVFFLDDVDIGDDLSDSATSVDTPAYSATASAGIFYLTVKSNLTQGYHTWKVVAYNDAGIAANSETWTFYVDSIYPFISVTKVHNTTLTWDTSNPSTLPTGDARYLTVSTANPILKGGVEVSANFQIILICPINIPTCLNQIYTDNIPSGLWSYQFFDMMKDVTYTVHLSATDTAGNSTIFPDFYLTYGTTTITVTPTPKDTANVLPTASPSAATLPGGPTLTPPPGLLNIVTPTPFVYAPPSAPTIPPVRVDRASLSLTDMFYYFLLILLILGLPLHLLMSIISTQTPFAFIPRFLFILAYPFLRFKTYRTTPFSFITIFAADKLDHPWKKVVSDVQGYFTIPSSIPDQVYVVITAVDRFWKDTLMRGSTVLNSCLYPRTYIALSGRSSLRKVLFDTRIIPLIIACITSATVMVIRPSYPVLIYVYFSFQYLFSEYLYPRIVK